MKQADRASWLAALFAPADKRPALHAVQAFCLEIAAVRTKVREPLAGELRLQWWTDAIEGEARGDVRGHPVAAALIDTIRACKLPRTALTDLVEARRADLYDEPIEDLAAFDRWAERTEGAAVALRAAVLTDVSPALADTLRHAGRAAGVLAAVTMLGQSQAARTEVRLPLDLLKAEGIGTAEVAVRRMSPAIARVLIALVRHADDEMRWLRSHRATIPDVAGPALLPVNLVPTMLRGMKRPASDPFGRPPALPLWRTQWILWRAARRGGIL